MAIHSYAFGRVTLSGEDAKKFKRQFTYGKPSKAAKDTAQRGVEMSRSFKENGGTMTLTIKPRDAS